MSINGRPLRRRPTGQHCRTGHNRSKLKIQFRLFHGALHSQCCTLPPPPGKCSSCHRQGGMAALYPFFFLLLMLCTVGPTASTCILWSAAWRYGIVPPFTCYSAVQPVLYLTVGMPWHCTVLLRWCTDCTANIVSYRRHGMALYRLTPDALYSEYSILPSAWHSTVPSHSWCTDCTASIVSYRRHGMAMYRLTHGALTVQPVLYLTVGMVWHSVYRLTSDALYSKYCILPSAWHGTVPSYSWYTVQPFYRRHGRGMALHRLNPVPCNVQPALYLTQGMLWHRTVLPLVHWAVLYNVY